MKKINDWVIRTFGLIGSWSWAKKQMLNGAIIKRKATIGTYKIAGMQQCHSIQGLGITQLRNLLTNYTGVNLYIPYLTLPMR